MYIYIINMYTSLLTNMFFCKIKCRTIVALSQCETADDSYKQALTYYYYQMLYFIFCNKNRYSSSTNSVKVLLQLTLAITCKTTLKSKQSMEKRMMYVSISLLGVKSMFYYTVPVVSWQHGGTMEHQEMGNTVGHKDHGGTPQSTQLESYTFIVGEKNVSAVTKWNLRLIIRQEK